MTRRALGCWAAASCVAAGSAAAQQVERGAIMLLSGTDTIVTDRFARSPDALSGTVHVKGQPRIEYAATLSGQMVRSLTLVMFAAGAPANASPTLRLRVTMLADTAVVETAAGTHRIATRPGAIPMFNNALALSEQFTRRARGARAAESLIPFFALSGGVTLDVTLRAVGEDSMTFAVPGQVQRLRVDTAGRILGGTIAGTPFVFARSADPGAGPVTSALLRDSPIAPAADYAAPPGAPYVAEEVRIPGPVGALAGTLTKPRGAPAKLPVVVTISGSGQQDRDEYIPFAGGIRLFREVADTLGRRGIAVLRLDDRGVGGSEGGAQLAASTSEDFANDIRAAIAWLRGRGDVDPDRIALLGHSEGGAIAPMIAATDPRLRALVVMAGPGEPAIEISMAQNRYIVDRDSTLTASQRDSVLRAARASLDPAKQAVPWVKYWMAWDPAPVARLVRAPVLILQGETDRQVPADQAEKLAALIRAGGNRDVTVRVFPATNHLFVNDPDGDFANYDRLRSNRIRRDVLGALADWLVVKMR